MSTASDKLTQRHQNPITRYDDAHSHSRTAPEHGDDPDGEEEEGNNRLMLSETMARTIKDLERLVDEAVKLAESVETLDPKTPGTACRSQLGLAKKISQYLQEASLNPDNPPSGVQDGSPNSMLISQQSPNVKDDEDMESELHRILPPRPILEPLHDRKTKLVRSRTVSGIDTSQKVAAPVTSPPQIGPRVTFADRDIPQKLPPPAIHLNGEESGVKFDEDKSPLLGAPAPGHERHFSQMFGIPSRHVSIDMAHPTMRPQYKIDLNGTQHVDINESSEDINVHSTCHHAPVARSWPQLRKRFAAWISCVNTACLGLLIGIYAGEVPAIQYVIVDLNRQVILGNVFLYIGLASATLIFWPLPLLHGRKPYNVVALVLATCLQIPQGVMVLSFRDPDVDRYRIILLLSRGLSGFVLGFVNINNFATLLDVFGASIQISESHQVSDPHDVRRHGGGIGVWLSVWSSCTIGSISIGFLLGTLIISSASVDWGFWMSALLLMFVTLLNVIAPEVRRSAFRRTITEIAGTGGDFSRVARGEVKFHLTGNGPYWWGEEIMAGIRLSWRMVQQPGFLVVSMYGAWVYAQFILVVMVSSAPRSNPHLIH